MYILDGVQPIARFEHHNFNQEHPLSNYINILWKALSGNNKFKLIHLARFYFKPESHTGPLDRLPFLDIEEQLVLVISFKFYVHSKDGKTTVVSGNFDIPEYLLFKTNITSLKSKGFSKYVHKCFARNDVDINNTWITDILVSYHFKFSEGGK